MTILGRLRPAEGWIPLVLLFFLLLTTVLSLQAAEWAPGLELLTGAMIAAFIVGWLFAKSRLAGFFLHPFSLVLGVLWVGYLGLGLTTEGSWVAQVSELILRPLLWLRDIQAGRPNGDTLPFVLTMGGLVWLISYGAVWDFFRARHIWGVLLPSAITILINTYYAREDLILLLVVYLLLAFLLIVLSNLLENERRWQREDVTYSRDIQFDFLRDGMLFALFVVGLAWFLPATIDHAAVSPTLTRLTSPWGRAQQEWNRFFGTLNYRSAGTGTFFDESMTFRGPLIRGDALVMHVRADRGRYWRAIVRDSYTSAGWTVTDDEIVRGPSANTPFEGETIIAGPGRVAVDQTYTIYRPAGTQLIAAGEPIALSLDVRLRQDPAPVSVEGPQPLQLFATNTLFQGQQYNVTSAIPQIDVEMLRSAGTAYPPALFETYTQLPETLSPRVGELAQTITRDAETPYDKAKQLESYLRTYPYNEDIPGPQPGEDGVEYFLFREKQGYCDYYASSMAVMLRSLGIPARLASGYAQGSLLEPGLFEVRQLNAHTWVEVYFPGFGWIEFEPTAAEPSLDRPLSLEQEFGPDSADEGVSASLNSNDEMLDEMADLRGDSGVENETAGPEQGLQERLFAWVPTINWRATLPFFGVLAVLAVVAGAGWGLLQHRWRDLNLVERLFDQLRLFGRALGQKPDPALTPHEYARRVGDQVPPAQAALNRVTDLFVRHRFSPNGAIEPEEENEVMAEWQDARKRLVRGVAERVSPVPPSLNGRSHNEIDTEG